MFFTEEMLHKDTRYVYFVRLSEYGLPPYEKKEDIYAEMASHFLIGSTSGRFLQSIDHLLNDVTTQNQPNSKF